MSNGILSQLPDLSGVIEGSTSLETDLQGVLGIFGSLTGGESDSPVGVVFQTFAELETRLDIDVSPLTEQLPAAMQSIRNALPANSIEYAESIGEAYDGVRDLLQNSALIQQIPEGGSLQAVALAVLTDAQTLFDSRLTELTGNLIDPQTLNTLQAAFTALDQFESDFPAHQDQFLPFITDHLLGIAPDLLDGPLAHVSAALDVVGPLAPDALAGNFDPVRQEITTAYQALVNAIEGLDPADANAYATIQVQLDALSSAAPLAFNALTTLYQALDGLIANHAWDTIFSTYVDLLDALAFDDVLTVDDIIHSIRTMLESLLANLGMAFEADDLRLRLETLNQTLRETFISSPLGQVRQTLEDFLGEIRQTIEAVPTEEVQAAVEDMLGQVGETLTDLGLTDLQATINNAFAELETFINDNLNQALNTEVQDNLAELLGQVQELPLAGLITNLSDAVSQIQSLITDLETALQGELNALTDLLAQLDDLSFRPVSDAVIAEINDLKGRLDAINPNALSDAEKLAIQGALAVLEAIDLEDKVIDGLKTGYHTAEREIKSLLDQIVEALNRLFDHIRAFSPDQLLQPVNELLNTLNGLVDQANGQTLIAPLYGLLDDLQAQLESLAPGRLLDPLQGPYDQLMGVINRLDPAEWVAPLEALYAQIDTFIDFIDITPILEELDQRQRDLFSDIRTAILTALDDLGLPEPLNSFLGELQPVLALLTEAIFGDPETELPRLSLEIRNRLDLGSLFAPLDVPFLRLIDLLASIPEADLTTTMNTIRQTIGGGMTVLNPQTIIEQLRHGHDRLVELAPGNLLGPALNLPALQLAFEARAAAAPPDRQGDVAAVSARFEATFSLVSPELPEGQMQQLSQTHQSVLQTLRQRINALNTGPAAAHYAQLRRNLERLVPDFLRQSTPSQPRRHYGRDSRDAPGQQGRSV